MATGALNPAPQQTTFNPAPLPPGPGNQPPAVTQQVQAAIAAQIPLTAAPAKPRPLSNWRLTHIVKQSWQNIRLHFRGLNTSDIELSPLAQQRNIAAQANAAEQTHAQQAQAIAQKTIMLPEHWRTHASLFSYLAQLGVEMPPNNRHAQQFFDAGPANNPANITEMAGQYNVLSLMMNQTCDPQSRNKSLSIDEWVGMLERIVSVNANNPHLSERFKQDVQKIKEASLTLKSLENVFALALNNNAIKQNELDEEGIRQPVPANTAPTFTNLFAHDRFADMAHFLQDNYTKNCSSTFSSAVKDLRELVLQGKSADGQSQLSRQIATKMLHIKGLRDIKDLKKGTKSLTQHLLGYQTILKNQTTFGRSLEFTGNILRRSLLTKTAVTGIMTTLSVLTFGGSDTFFASLPTMADSAIHIPSILNFFANTWGYFVAGGAAFSLAGLIGAVAHLHKEKKLSLKNIAGIPFKTLDFILAIPAKMAGKVVDNLARKTLLSLVIKCLIERPLRRFNQDARESNYDAYLRGLLAQDEGTIFIDGVHDVDIATLPQGKQDLAAQRRQIQEQQRFNRVNAITGQHQTAEALQQEVNRTAKNQLIHRQKLASKLVFSFDLPPVEQIPSYTFLTENCNKANECSISEQNKKSKKYQEFCRLFKGCEPALIDQVFKIFNYDDHYQHLDGMLKKIEKAVQEGNDIEIKFKDITTGANMGRTVITFNAINRRDAAPPPPAPTTAADHAGLSPLSQPTYTAVDAGTSNPPRYTEQSPDMDDRSESNESFYSVIDVEDLEGFEELNAPSPEAPAPAPAPVVPRNGEMTERQRQHFIDLEIGRAKQRLLPPSQQTADYKRFTQGYIEVKNQHEANAYRLGTAFINSRTQIRNSFESEQERAAFMKGANVAAIIEESREYSNEPKRIKAFCNGYPLFSIAQASLMAYRQSLPPDEQSTDPKLISAEDCGFINGFEPQTETDYNQMMGNLPQNQDLSLKKFLEAGFAQSKQYRDQYPVVDATTQEYLNLSSEEQTNLLRMSDRLKAGFRYARRVNAEASKLSSTEERTAFLQGVELAANYSMSMLELECSIINYTDRKNAMTFFNNALSEGDQLMANGATMPVPKFSNMQSYSSTMPARMRSAPIVIPVAAAAMPAVPASPLSRPSSARSITEGLAVNLSAFGLPPPAPQPSSPRPASPTMQDPAGPSTSYAQNFPPPAPQPSSPRPASPTMQDPAGPSTSYAQNFPPPAPQPRPTRPASPPIQARIMDWKASGLVPPGPIDPSQEQPDSPMPSPRASTPDSDVSDERPLMPSRLPAPAVMFNVGREADAPMQGEANPRPEVAAAPLAPPPAPRPEAPPAAPAAAAVNQPDSPRAAAAKKQALADALKGMLASFGDIDKVDG